MAGHVERRGRDYFATRLAHDFEDGVTGTRHSRRPQATDTGSCADPRGLSPRSSSRHAPAPDRRPPRRWNRRKGSLPRPDLHVLGKVVVHMLAARDKASRYDGGVGDDARTTAVGGDSTSMAFLAGQRVPDDVARAHRTSLRVRGGCARRPGARPVSKLVHRRRPDPGRAPRERPCTRPAPIHRCFVREQERRR